MKVNFDISRISFAIQPTSNPKSSPASNSEDFGSTMKNGLSLMAFQSSNVNEAVNYGENYGMKWGEKYGDLFGVDETLNMKDKE